MLSAQVILLLERAGVTEIDRLSPVLTALKRYLDPIEEPESHPLSDKEQRFLSAVGAFGLDLHPLALERFFLNPCPDLEMEGDSETLSPREWLIDGRGPEPICQIVREL